MARYEGGWAEARETGWQSHQDALARWVETLPRPVGIMACNDLMGQFVLEACRNSGAKVPDDVAVIGVDNDRVLCSFCDPPLTSVMPAARQIGIEAARMLDCLMTDIRLRRSMWSSHRWVSRPGIRRTCWQSTI